MDAGSALFASKHQTPAAQHGIEHLRGAHQLERTTTVLHLRGAHQLERTTTVLHLLEEDFRGSPKRFSAYQLWIRLAVTDEDDSEMK